MKGAVSISQEGPEELDPTIGKEEAILDVVCLEAWSGGTKLYLCLFQGVEEEVAVGRVTVSDFQEELEGYSAVFPV